LLNYKKYQYEKATAAKNDKIFNYKLPPAFCQTNVSCSLFIL